MSVAENLPENYKPSDKEEYMNPQHLAYFKAKLTAWKEELMLESADTLENLKNESLNESDPNDRASVELDTNLELRARDRARKLVKKIDKALDRIAIDDYGFCEITGKPIGLKRLDARPIATLCIEAQEAHESHEDTHIDPDAESKF